MTWTWDMRKAVLCACLTPLIGIVCGGCSSQDFGRPVGRLADIVDSRRAYVETDEKQQAAIRAEKLGKVLATWEKQKGQAGDDYTIGPDDVLEISVLALEAPEKTTVLNRSVSKDGTITLPLVNTVTAGGISARKVQAKLIDLYKGKYLKDPQVNVAVSEYRSAPVVLTGAVTKPGVYYLRHNQSSVLEVLSMADGLTDAAGDAVLIVRGRPGTPPETNLTSAAPLPAAPLSPAVTPIPLAQTNALQTPPGQPSTVAIATTSVAVATSTGVVAETGATPPVSLGSVTPGPEAPTNRPSFFARLFGKGKKQDVAAATGIVAVAISTGTVAEAGATPQVAAESSTPAAQTPTNRPSFFARLFGGGKKQVVATAASPTGTVTNPPPLVAAAAPKPEPGQAAPPAAPGAANERLTADASLSNEFAAAAATDIIEVDLQRLLDGGDARLNVDVRGGDIVTVPPHKKQYVYVLGYVQRPGAYELKASERVRALDAVAMAGGLSAAARAQNSFLIIERPEGRKVVDVDLTKIARGVRPPVYMEAGMTLVVGSGFFAKLGEFVKPSIGASASVAPMAP
jgi:protein involved in polysaccharide export with SLBB domain